MGAWPEKWSFFRGTTPCLSALLAAERYAEILDLLESSSMKFWSCHNYGVKALAALGWKNPSSGSGTWSPLGAGGVILCCVF